MPIAPPLQRTSRIGFRWVILALICAGTTINYINRLVIGILAPDLQSLYHITDSQYGYISAAFSFAYAFGQLGIGKLLDRIGTRVGYGLALAGWSISAMLTALGRGALSFSLLRALLGVTESPGYPAAAKVCAEWFPRRQRAFAFGFVNAGCNMSAIIAALIVPYLSIHYGWQAAFIVIGAMGLILLAVWIPLYKSPQVHPLLGASELALIESDPPESTARLKWRQVLRYRQSWVFVVGKFLTDACWWFFMTFIPKILNGAPFHLGLSKVGLPLVAIYFMADVGSVGGGWISSVMIHRGFTVNFARKITMLVMAMLVLPMMSLPWAPTALMAVLILGLATAGHQGFSSNNYTLCSDLFPKSMVGVISGLGGFFGYIGASIFTAFTGYWVQYRGNYIAPCIIASSAYLISILAIHLVSPRLTPVKIVEQRD
ncbi:MAG: MFS transporter [Tepidisphaeraceae bacterium]|jgi:ACS family hexuronate transporter-like MFS transporter